MRALVNLTVAEINIVTQSNLGRKHFIWLSLPNHSPAWREVRAGIQEGVEAETLRNAVC